MNSFSKACVGILVAATLIAFGSRAAVAQKPAPPKKGAPAAAKHVLLPPGAMKWGPAPDALPPGAQLAVVDGDPSKAGPYSIELKFPAGYRVAPHWHPADENIVVLSGTFMVGVGDKMDEAAMQTMPAGSYGKMPRQMHHYAMAKTEATIHIYGMGPFAVTYVNPSDDPRKKTTTK